MYIAQGCVQLIGIRIIDWVTKPLILHLFPLYMHAVINIIIIKYRGSWAKFDGGGEGFE